MDQGDRTLWTEVKPGQPETLSAGALNRLAAESRRAGSLGAGGLGVSSLAGSLNITDPRRSGDVEFIRITTGAPNADEYMVGYIQRWRDGAWVDTDTVWVRMAGASQTDQPELPILSIGHLFWGRRVDVRSSSSNVRPVYQIAPATFVVPVVTRNGTTPSGGYYNGCYEGGSSDVLKIEVLNDPGEIDEGTKMLGFLSGMTGGKPIYKAVLGDVAGAAGVRVEDQNFVEIEDPTETLQIHDEDFTATNPAAGTVLLKTKGETAAKDSSGHFMRAQFRRGLIVSGTVDVIYSLYTGTITLAKLTAKGSNGSLSFSEGHAQTYTAPT